MPRCDRDNWAFDGNYWEHGGSCLAAAARGLGQLLWRQHYAAARATGLHGLADLVDELL